LAAGLVAGCFGLFPGSRVADADRGGDRVRFGDRVPGNNRSGASCLEAPHDRVLGGYRFEDLAGIVGPLSGVLLVALPVRGDVARVAYWQQVVVRCVAQEVHDLEGAGLLALDTRRVHRVDQEYRVVLAELAGDLKAVIEIAVDLDDVRTVGDRLGHLAHGDLAIRYQHGALQAGLGGVGRG